MSEQYILSLKGEIERLTQKLEAAHSCCDLPAVLRRAEHAEAIIKAALDYIFANAEPKSAYDDCDCGCTEDYVLVSTMKRILTDG